MKVSELMTWDVLTVEEGTSLEDAARLMRDFNLGLLPIKQGERMVGVVTDRDIAVKATAMGLDPREMAVGAVMTREVFCCHRDDDVLAAARLMAARRLRRLPVLDDSWRLAGLLSLADLARAHRPGLCGWVLEQITRRNSPDDWPLQSVA